MGLACETIKTGLKLHGVSCCRYAVSSTPISTVCGGEATAQTEHIVFPLYKVHHFIQKICVFSVMFSNLQAARSTCSEYLQVMKLPLSVYHSRGHEYIMYYS